MNKYGVYFCKETILAYYEVEAENETEAYEKASMKVHKYDLDATDYEHIKILDEEIEDE